MNTIAIKPPTLAFLKDLADNNNREWFNERKPLYLDAQENMCLFIDALISEMNRHDLIENTSGKKSLYRIYNDVRFSKDKSPYNPRFAFSLQRATALRRGGYYMNIQPGQCFLACGFFAPNPEDLQRIRMDIDQRYALWHDLLNENDLKATFGEMQGDKVGTAPRGFKKDHPGIELLRYKQYLFMRNFTDEEVLSPNFLAIANESYKSVRPFFDYMSEILTTNVNGESIV